MKNTRITLLASAMLLVAGSAAANDTAVINLSATVSPGSCTIAASNTNLDLGSVSFAELNAATPTTLPFAENPRITIECSALHQGVYFSVAPAIAGPAADVYSLGDLDGTSVAAGTYSLLAAAPADENGPLADAAVNCREDVATAPAVCVGPVRSDRQYTFGSVLATGINDLSFDLLGSVTFPPVDDMEAADANITSAAQTFATSYTVTAVF